MPAISIIVPVYNAEPYLQQCLDSICAQTFLDFEAICVDDGSSDDSAEICSKYSSLDSRFRLIRKPNSGPGAARNAGIAVATGEYFAFLDADDFYENNFLQAMYDRLINEQADLCYCVFDIFHNASGMYFPQPPTPLPRTSSFTPLEYSENLYEMLGTNIWNKLVSRQLVQCFSLEFPTIRRGEDLYFSLRAATVAKRIAFIDQPLVHLRRGIQTNVESNGHLSPLDFCKSLLLLKEKLEKNGSFHIFQQSYYDMVMRTAVYQLDTQRSKKDFIYVRNYLSSVLFPKLGMAYAHSCALNSKYLRLQYFLIIHNMPRFFMLALGAVRYLQTRGITATLRGVMQRLKG